MSPTRYLSRSFIRGAGSFFSAFHRTGTFMNLQVKSAARLKMNHILAHYDTVIQPRRITKRCDGGSKLNGRKIKEMFASKN